MRVTEASSGRVAILAGGMGRRLGGVKPAMLLGGRPLVEYPIRAAREAGLDAVVVAKRDSPLPQVDCPVVYEPDSPQHPLCGIVAALMSGGSATAVACDMPFVTPALLARLCGSRKTTFAQLGGRPQPLLARYSGSDLPSLETALHAGRTMRETLSLLDARALPEHELARYGDPARLCFNVNGEEDLRVAEAWLR